MDAKYNGEAFTYRTRQKDVAERIGRLEAYERWRPPTRIDDFEAILGTEEWAAYWRAWEKINADLRECQKVADDLRAKIEKALPKQLRGAAVIPLDVRTKIVRVVAAAVLLGDDVLDVKGVELVVVLVKPAVLTAAASPLPGEGSEGFVHHLPSDGGPST